MFTYTPYIWPLLIATVLCIVIAFYVQKYPETPASRPFIYMMWVGAGWTAFYGLSIITVWYPLRLFLSMAMYIPSRLMAPVILYMALEYTGKGRWITTKHVILVLLIPIIAILASMTSPWHTLFRYNFVLDATGSLPILYYTPGPIFTLSNIYNSVVILGSLVIMLSSLQDRALKPQSTLLLMIGILIPIIVEILFINNITPIKGYNLAASTVVFTGGTYLVALMKYRLFGFVPIARSTVLEHISDLVIVFDNQAQIVDANPAAIQAIGLNPKGYVGIPNDYLPGHWGTFFKIQAELGPGQRDVELLIKDEQKIFDLTVKNIVDSRARSLGILFLLHDITNLRISEQKIKQLLDEKTLLLREVHHRIKNNLSVIGSLLSLQSETVQDEAAKNALLEARNRVQSMSILYDKLYRSDGSKEMPLDEYLSPLIDKLVSMFPLQPYVRIIKQIEPIVINAKILFSLGIIVNELLTNALKYAFAPGESGAIQIVSSMQGDLVTISVIDSGGKYSDNVASSTAGFGLQVVQLMAKQIGAQFKIYTSTNGKAATIADISFYKG
ncbi:sensor histidine kinase [Gracilinema caldarium]|uniref:histidine kinase n=1 Tax=Gracilinema caldarium (strain ATCC 51460 / DSM 7334 / H1) TaxID=744872 RepID=F8F0C2_GRAC1|nr:histidine kinase N-terminal 7TM domain-containing protein [Gracilinema caldarium]AEJ18986.1 signal transduction histidine kinase [Gracilinema caldarium DSM 7334]